MSIRTSRRRRLLLVAVAAGLLGAGVALPAAATTQPSRPKLATPVAGRSPLFGPLTPLLRSVLAQRTPAASTGTGRTTTIGTASLPQVVRVGETLRQINPSNPSAYLPGNYRFAGVDGYELTTDWSVNVGCGPSDTDAQLNGLLSSLGKGSVVRAWFFQGLATNKATGARDWDAMDRLVNAASAHGIRLIATLGNQDGSCDDGVWKDPSWYSGGYRSVVPGYSQSYLVWVQSITSRYRNNPAILAWEPVNEPRPDTCTNTADCWSNRVCPSDAVATTALRSFYDTIGAAIRAEDPNHLISDGAPPVEGCGTRTWTAMQTIDGSPGVDLVSYHDYEGPVTMSASNVTNFGQLTATVDKPIFAGENGGMAAVAEPGADSSCPTQATRAAAYQQDLESDFSGVPAFVGWLFWNAMPGPGQPCDYATEPGDPLLTMLSSMQAQLNGG